MVQQSESVAKLFAALVAAGAQFRNPPKDSVNPHFKSKYADLATVLDTVRPVLAAHKLAVIQLPVTLESGAAALATTVVHESGEWIRGTVHLHASKTDPQGIGSALTYARRYGLQAALGIAADEDDDGHAASRPAAPARQQAARPEQPPAKEPKAKKQDDPKTLAELYSRLMAVETPAPADLSRYLAGAAGHLSRLSVDCPPETLADSLAAFLKLKPGEPIPFDKLTAAQVTSGWNHVKQTVKRFADAEPKPQPPQAP